MATLYDIQENGAGQVQRDLESRGINGKELVTLMYTGLVEEAGEVAGVFKRRIRKGEKDAVPASDRHLVEEIGDVLWYLVGLCYSLGFEVDDIWSKNIEKLEERYGRDY